MNSANTTYRRLLIFVVVAFVIPIATAGGDGPEKPKALKDFIASLQKPIVLRGDFLKAVLVAYQDDFSDFIKRKERIAQKGSSAEREPSPLRFLSRLENYDIAIEQRGDNYVVSFGPTMRGNVPEIFGGGAQYLIDAKTFELREKQYTK